MTPAEIKEALNDRAEEFAQWLFPAGRLHSGEWQVGSLSGEQGKSCCIRVRGSKIGVFKDFAADDGGDNLVELYGQAKRVEFKEALRACADWLEVTINPHDFRASSKTVPHAQPSPFPTPMSDSENEQALGMAVALRADRELYERIAKARNWRPETIVELTHEPSLGWHHGKLAFLYESGVKLRWREDGGRVIRWAFGKPWLWRGGYLWCRSTIYFCEGETDAISLIDAGIEKDGKTLAVGLPSASTFNGDWAQLFTGKDVVLALDGDKAGQEATTKISGLLQPVVKTLKQVNWGGLQHAS